MIARLMVHSSRVVASLDKMLHDNYLCLVESNKQQIEEVRKAKFKRKTWKQGQLLSESEFVLCLAPPSLSREKIKMKKLNQLKSQHWQDLDDTVSDFANAKWNTRSSATIAISLTTEPTGRYLFCFTENKTYCDVF